ncbi:MAG: exo-alpha-sialidase, partial [Pseudomonadales bacterium]|nr:exo-alpha-sialidase [Pseudomonadales bacterium]
MHSTIKLIVIFTFTVLFGVAWTTGITHPRTSDFVVPKVHPPATDEPFYNERFASWGMTREAHSASAYTYDGKIKAFWYGGTQEGAGDVNIYSTTFAKGEWSKPRAIIDVATVEKQLDRFVRKVGNAVAYHRGNGRIWLFFVSVSVGGWGGSSINLITSTDHGKTWSPAKRLVTSPFLNISTLVKNPAFEYADGTIGLPVYHEFIGKFGEILRLDSSGRILSKTRLSWGQSSLQPIITPISTTTAVGYMRYAEHYGRVLHTVTHDRGLTWSKPGKLKLKNPNSPVFSFYTGQEILLIINNADNNRTNLTLAASQDGESWELVHKLESIDPGPT